MRILVLTLSLLLLTGCAALKSWRYPPNGPADERTIHVIGNGWHTGIVIPAAELPAALDFLRADFGPTPWYEFGWGDRAFYQAGEVTSGLTLQAVLWPTPAVMHVVAVPETPPQYYAGYANAEVVELTLSSEGLDRLTAAIARQFAFDGEGAPARTQPGLYGESWFYLAGGRYWAPNTCNTWTARMLDRAGVPVRVMTTLTAGGVIGQAERAERRQGN